MAGQLNPEIRVKFWSKFTGWCHQAVVLGYIEMRKKPIDCREWEEEDISKALYLEMKKLDIIKSRKISIIPEFRMYGKEYSLKEGNAKEADRIDFRFSNWKSKKELEYFGEAKNLSLKDWTKSCTSAKINASKYRGRYIDTGIKKLITGGYALLDGFLIGFVVNGSAKKNVSALNKLISTRSLPPDYNLIENKKTIRSYSECYSSKNIKGSNEVILEHIFLEFDS